MAQLKKQNSSLHKLDSKLLRGMTRSESILDGLDTRLLSSQFNIGGYHCACGQYFNWSYSRAMAYKLQRSICEEYYIQIDNFCFICL